MLPYEYVSCTTISQSLILFVSLHSPFFSLFLNIHQAKLGFLKGFDIFFNIYIFCLQWIFTAACRLPLVAESSGYSLVAVHGLLIVVASLVTRTQILGHTGFSSQCTWAQRLWYTGLVTPWHVGSCQKRDQTSVLCIARWILNHWATRKAFYISF